jgi:hypothetical protein
MSEKSETTISWSAAVHQVALAGGQNDASEKLLELVLGNRVRYEPRGALSLRSAREKHLIDLRTGALRMHPSDDRPRHVRIFEDDLNGYLEPRANQAARATNSYMPEYLALIHKAIEYFSISDEHQPKAQELTDWFRSQVVDGAKVPNNLASAMATIARKADRKKGGAVRRRTKG